MQNDTTAFVHEGVEVCKTGRVALRRSTRATKDTEHQLVEICPTENPNLWKKWVNPASLYIIEPGIASDGTA